MDPIRAAAPTSTPSRSFRCMWGHFAPESGAIQSKEDERIPYLLQRPLLQEMVTLGGPSFPLPPDPGLCLPAPLLCIQPPPKYIQPTNKTEPPE